MIKSERVAAGAALIVLVACAPESDRSKGADTSDQEAVAPVESSEGKHVIRMSDTPGEYTYLCTIHETAGMLLQG